MNDDDIEDDDDCFEGCEPYCICDLQHTEAEKDSNCCFACGKEIT